MSTLRWLSWSPPDSPRSPTSSSSSARLDPPPADLEPPTYPAYLEHTLYADLAWKQYNYFKKRHMDFRRREKGLGRAPEYSEVWHQIDLRLPSVLNREDKSRHLEVGETGLDLTYTGPGKSESHAASVRSDFPMPRQCGIYYFEMRVISKGEDGFIGIGFCSGRNELDRLPGWDKDSWGYHGDDGHSFEGSGTGKTYGPCFTTGDVIGCGVNMADGSAFYTKNGVYLGTAFRSIPMNTRLYPCIGLRTPGERVHVNFGKEPFVFDIIHYTMEQSSVLRNDIAVRRLLAASPSSSNQKIIDATDITDRLVMSYLVYQGYRNTVLALRKDIQYTTGRTLQISHNGLDPVNPAQEETDAVERLGILEAIRAGDIDQAIQLADDDFPESLYEDRIRADMMFELKCRKFVEMMLQYCEQKKRSKSQRWTATRETMDDEDEEMVPAGSEAAAEEEEEGIPRVKSKRRFDAIDPSCSYDQRMDIDDGKAGECNGNASKRRGDTVSENGTDDTMTHIIEYGQQIQREYWHDTRPKIRNRLMEIFSLTAYPDPASSPMAHVMNPSGRERLATEVNAAILALQRRPETSPLERIYRQAVVTNEQLACLGEGKALLMDPRSAIE